MAAIPSIGPVTASLLVMKTPDPHAFRSGRDFAAWLGPTPKDHSTAGRQRLGVITRAGDETLRRLLVNGAMAVIKYAKPGRASPWLLNLLARKPKKVVAIGLANKADRLLAHMGKDKKVRDGRITLILPRRIGDAYVMREAQSEDLRAFLAAAA